MPTFRIVYIDDDTFAPRTLTAAFPHRAAAEIAMAKHGHRVVHIAELKLGESAADPISVAMADNDGAACGVSARGAAGDAIRKPREREPASVTPSLLGLPVYDLAGVAVVAAGIALAGAAILLL